MATQTPKTQNLSYFQKENMLFYALNTIYFAAASIYFGFLVMYLTSEGYSSFACGIINTLISVSTLIFQPIVGYITDTFITIKKYLIIVGVAAILTTFLLPLTVGTPILMAASVMLLALFVNPATFLADTWAVTLREKLPYIDYGKNRSGGSLGYAIMSMLAGFLIAPFGYMTLFVIHALLFVAYIIIVIQLPSVPCRNAKGTKANSKDSEPHNALQEESDSLSFLTAIKTLAKNPRYVMFLLCSIGYYITLKAVSANVPYKLMELGGGDSEMGIALAIGAVFEVPVLFIITRCIRKFKLSTLFLVSCTFVLLRGICMAAASSMFTLCISQMCQALSYGIYLAVSLEIVSKIVPNNIRATSITFMVGMTSGLGAIVGTFIAGLLVDTIGVTAMSWIMSIPSLCGLILYLFVTLSARKNRPDEVI